MQEIDKIVDKIVEKKIAEAGTLVKSVRPNETNVREYLKPGHFEIIKKAIIDEGKSIFEIETTRKF